MLDALLEKALGWLADAVVRRRRVRFTAHLAVFVDSDRLAYFLNVVNLSESREVEITHVWFASDPPVAALRVDRPLPRRLKPDEAWETWVFADELPAAARRDALRLARLRLSTGRVLRSRPDESVPPEGVVPGGPVTRRHTGEAE
jgi:hypothetical protein